MKTVAISGLGAIGWQVAQALDRGIEGLRLESVASRNREGTARRLAEFKEKPQIVKLSELTQSDIVVESTPATVFLDVVRPAVKAGKTLLVMSAGALLQNSFLIHEAHEAGAKLLVPSGAIGALDAVRAANEGVIAKLTLETRKPPKAYKNALWLLDHPCDLDNLTQAKCLFEGNALLAAQGFPANANVAAALALAGPGPEKTDVQIWADPNVTCNIHRIRLQSDSAVMETVIYGVPSPENPKTSRLAALSAIACLRSLTGPI